MNLDKAAGRDLTAQIVGASPEDTLGFSIATGNVNGDARDDLIISARLATPSGRERAGVVYVFYGNNLAAKNVYQLTQPAGTYGETRILGDQAFDVTGQSVACGDINGDGVDDMIIGAAGADASGGSETGAVFVIHGIRNGKVGTAALTGSTLNLNPNRNGVNVAVLGEGLQDRFGYGAESGADVDRNGFADFAASAFTNDHEDPQVDDDSEYAIAVFGRGTAVTAQRTLRMRNGVIDLKGVGGRLSPVMRTWMSFDGGQGIGSAISNATVTLTRNDAGLGNLMGGRTSRIADARWQLVVSRQNYTQAQLRFQYLDSEIAGMNENRLTVLQANSLSGPWTKPVQSVNTLANTISTEVGDFNHFVIVDAVAVVQASPSPLNFQKKHIALGAKILPLTLTNNGQASLTFTKPFDFGGANRADFSVVGTQDLSPLPPGGSRVVQIAFDPSTLGQKIARFRAYTNDPDSATLLVDLRGEGVNQTAAGNWTKFE